MLNGKGLRRTKQEHSRSEKFPSIVDPTANHLQHAKSSVLLTKAQSPWWSVSFLWQYCTSWMSSIWLSFLQPLQWCLPNPSTLFYLWTNYFSLQTSDVPQLILNPIQSSFSQILLGSQQVARLATWCYLEIISEQKKKIKEQQCLWSFTKKI